MGSLKPPKYLCHGGYVRSRHDGEIHYVSARRMPQLYGVDPAECMFTMSEGARPYFAPPWLIDLVPDPTGQYVVPGES